MVVMGGKLILKPNGGLQQCVDISVRDQPLIKHIPTHLDGKE